MEATKEMTTELAELNRKIADLGLKNAELVKSQSEGKFASTGRIARTIAHEIRNPLTNINLAVEQLVTELPPDETSVFLLDMINRNSKRINQIISELLNSTRFSDLDLGSTSLHGVLDEVLSEANDRLASQNVQVVKSFDANIKDITVDKDKLKQAFQNLVINSLEAMEGKTGAVLSLVTQKKQDEVIITLTDNGKGMSEEDEKRVFEPYFTKKQSGLGLSLTTTQNIILNHKGIINVKSKQGEGTSFIISLKSGN